MRAFLIVRLGALGDVVHTMPVVSALRRQWPSAQIDWLVDPRYVDVVQLVDGVSRAIAFDPRGLMVGSERRGTLAAIAELRHAQYDVVFDLQGLVKSAAAARLAGGGETVGFGKEHLREAAARFFYTRQVDVPAGLHIIEKNLRALTAVDVPVVEPRFELTVPPSPQREHLQSTFGGTGYVAINPGAAWPNKRWPADRFGEVAARIHSTYGLRTLVVWGPGEESLAESVVAASAGSAELAPATRIVELFDVLRGARLTIAGDTGPLHIAVAVGTPVVALFGPTDPRRNGPWCRDDVSVSRFEQCECHYERRCRRTTACIDDITVDEVANAAAVRLQQADPGARA